VETQFGKHVVETWRQTLTRSDLPSLAPSPEKEPSSEALVHGRSPRELVLGPFSCSEFLLELTIQGVVHLGSPKVRRRDGSLVAMEPKRTLSCNTLVVNKIR
jgi:hypothetical protein